MEIHQVIDTATPGDAIFNDALAIRAQLRQFTPSEIVCDRIIHEGLLSECVSTKDYERAQRARRVDASEDVLIVHASIGNEDLHHWVMARPERVIVRYHNITPAKFFREINPMFAEFLDLGREQLGDLSSKAMCAIAASEYNASELPSYGYGGPSCPIFVMPPFFPHGEFEGVVRRPPPVGHAPIILFVGQFLPHKRPDLLIEAFHVLASYMEPRSHLVIVGQMRAEGYAKAVRAMASDLVLPNTHFAGVVSQPQLVEYFATASAVVMTSEHEGFCVPMVEAMSAGVPVVARRFGAVAETAGEATPEGSAVLLVEPEDDALVIAEAMWAVATDAALNATLVAKGKARADHFHPVRTAERFMHILGRVLL